MGYPPICALDDQLDAREALKHLFQAWGYSWIESIEPGDMEPLLDGVLSGWLRPGHHLTLLHDLGLTADRTADGSGFHPRSGFLAIADLLAHYPWLDRLGLVVPTSNLPVERWLVEQFNRTGNGNYIEKESLWNGWSFQSALQGLDRGEAVLSPHAANAVLEFSDRAVDSLPPHPSRGAQAIFEAAKRIRRGPILRRDEAIILKAQPSVPILERQPSPTRVDLTPTEYLRIKLLEIGLSVPQIAKREGLRSPASIKSCLEGVGLKLAAAGLGRPRTHAALVTSARRHGFCPFTTELEERLAMLEDIDPNDDLTDSPELEAGESSAVASLTALRRTPNIVGLLAFEAWSSDAHSLRISGLRSPEGVRAQLTFDFIGRRVTVRSISGDVLLSAADDAILMMEVLTHSDGPWLHVAPVSSFPPGGYRGYEATVVECLNVAKTRMKELGLLAEPVGRTRVKLKIEATTLLPWLRDFVNTRSRELERMLCEVMGEARLLRYRPAARPDRRAA
jgi:hypothetical protein